MRYILVTMVSLYMISSSSFASSKLTSENDKINYSIGVKTGENLKLIGIELDSDLLVQGLKDFYNGKNLKLTNAEIDETIQVLQQKQFAKIQEQEKKLAVKTLEQGKEFLSKNKANSDINTLDSGLQYKVVTAGTGKKPSLNDSVTVHYRGTLIDGTEFDSSYKRNEPATFKLNGLIPGWQEALQLMESGSKWKIYLPSELAYGENGAGPIIKPNSALIFDIELVSIN